MVSKLMFGLAVLCCTRCSPVHLLSMQFHLVGQSSAYLAVTLNRCLITSPTRPVTSLKGYLTWTRRCESLFLRYVSILGCLSRTPCHAAHRSCLKSRKTSLANRLHQAAMQHRGPCCA